MSLSSKQIQGLLETLADKDAAIRELVGVAKILFEELIEVQTNWTTEGKEMLRKAEDTIAKHSPPAEQKAEERK